MIEDDAEDVGTPLGQTRQVTIDALCEHFANDVMPVEEFERRVDVAHQAASVDELRELLRDLPGGGLPVGAGATALPSVPRGYTVTRAENHAESAYAVAIMGGTRRAGRWTTARVNTAIAFCGGAEFDFREAVLAPGVTELRIFAMWGGVEVIVPPGLNVECHGVGIMGAFDHAPDLNEHDPTAPTLRITGVALMGGVDVVVRHPGESARDARQRRRAARHERLREVKSGAREIAEEAKRQLRRPGSGPV
ncbi:MAG: DUF1707 domain-containing protein [Longimicrobiales bacterium]